MEDSGQETGGESWRTVMRCLLGDQEEMSCFFFLFFFFVRCINSIIKAWDEVWALGTGSKDDFPN